ncbi:MAG: hypothetical protein U0625_08925 [Phycisphaerales bacterium]
MEQQTAPPIIPAPAISDARQAERLDDLLRTLGVMHAVLAGLCFLGAGIAVVAVVFVRLALSDPNFTKGAAAGQNPPPPWFFDMIVVVYGAMAVVAFLLMLANIAASVCAFRRRGRIFLMIVSSLNCPFFPIGTAQGVFGLIVLLRPGMRERFEATVPPPLPGSAA